MFTVEYKDYWTQLERILVELKDGRSVGLTDRRKLVEELVPLPAGTDARRRLIDQVLRNNIEYGWADSPGRVPICSHNEQILAILRRRTKLGHFRRYLAFIDYFLTDGVSALIDDFVRVHRLVAA